MRNRSGFCRLFGALLVLGVAAPLMAGSNDVLSYYPKHHAVVDWSRGVALVRGRAALPASAGPARLRVARAMALAHARQNLVALVAELTPPAGPARERARTAAVARLACRCPVFAERRLPGRGYQVTLRVPLVGRQGLYRALREHLRQRSPYTPSKEWTIATRDLPTTTGEEDLLTKPDAKGPFTGLIVDARGYQMQNSMSPVLYDAKLKEIYSGSHADVDFVEDVGVVGYMATIKAALATPRVGKNPLVVRASGSPDQFRRCAAVSEEDAKRIVDAEKEAGFFKKCAVTFVIDKAAGAPPSD